MAEDRPAAGWGAGGFGTVRPRYRTDDIDVQHAHGYVAQTLADLGFVGLALSLALPRRVGLGRARRRSAPRPGRGAPRS